MSVSILSLKYSAHFHKNLVPNSETLFNGIPKYMFYLSFINETHSRSTLSFFNKNKSSLVGVLNRVCNYITCISTKKWSFSLRISSANTAKSSVCCRFGHIYWRNPDSIKESVNLPTHFNTTRLLNTRT